MPDSHDPIEELRELASAASRRAKRPPAEEIRARGTRRHRRRIAATVTGACLGVSAITGGAVATVGQFTKPEPPEAATPSVSESPSSTPETSPTTNKKSPDPDPPKKTHDEVDNEAPPSGWRTEIPASFDLSVGLPDYGSDDTVEGPSRELRPFGTLQACGQQAYPGEPEVLDQLGLSWSAPAIGQLREVTVYQDAQAAHDVLQRLADSYADCPTETDGGAARFFKVEQDDIGDESWLVKQTLEQDGLPQTAFDQYRAVRIGNAVLLVSGWSEAGPEEAGIEQAVRELSRPVETIAEQQMCVFAKDPCTTDKRPSGTQTEQEPAESMTAANLLTAAEVVLNSDTSWGETNTEHGQGADKVAICQRDSLDSLGATDVWRRDFALQGSNYTVAQSAALQFGSDDSARQAYQTLHGWIADCPAQIRAAGHELHWQHKQLMPVSAGEVAEYATYAYGSVPADEEAAYWDSLGIVQVGSRVMIVSMITPGQDFNYSDQADPAPPEQPHPMIVTLPNAADRLDE